MKTKKNDETGLARLETLGEKSKKDIVALAITDAKTLSEGGRVNELEAYIRASKIAEYFSSFMKAMKPKAMAEALKEQPKGVFEKFYAKITHTSTAAKWNYDNCNDPKLLRLLEQQKKIKEQVEARQKFLQTLPEAGEEWVDLEGGEGEVFLLRRAVKTSEDTISITY